MSDDLDDDRGVLCGRIADLEERIASLLEEGKKGWTAADRARALAFEEAARHLIEYIIFGFGGEAGGKANYVADQIRALAPLPPTLRAVPVETLERVKVAVAYGVEWIDIERIGNPREFDTAGALTLSKLTAALAELEALR